MNQNSDLYSVLGVPKNASEDDIKKAYRKLARKYHPDAHPNDKSAASKFNEATEAYDVLGDVNKRRQYDQMRDNPFQGFGGARQGGGFQGGNIEYDLGGQGFGGIEDLLGSLFGGRGNPQSRSKGMRGSDREVEANIPLKQALEGTQVEVPGRTNRLKVRIPPGTLDGARIRVPEEGDPGYQNGDLYVVVKISIPSMFKREGDDLHLELPLSVFEAMFGAEIDVPTVEGHVKMKIPPQTQTGKTFRLKGKGIPHAKGGNGDQYVRVLVHIPLNVSEKDAEVWKALSQSPYNPRR
ncbi:MAG TPA: hypothetical protein DD435_05625 [Cyanobacteria bacterium UBA8530]|nr:hypothetical protein [Cyanobacteria bacterium UBA8530]